MQAGPEPSSDRAEALSGARLTASPEKATEDSGTESPDHVVEHNEERSELAEIKAEPSVMSQVWVNEEKLKGGGQQADP